MCVIDFRNVMRVFMFVKWDAIEVGRTPLWVAAEGGYLKVVAYLVTEVKVNPNQANEV